MNLFFPKKDSFVIPLSGQNVNHCSYGSIKGKQCKVIASNKIHQSVTIQIPGTNTNWNLSAASGDTWTLPTKEDMLAGLNERKVELQEQIKEIDSQIEFYTKYDDEDHFLAEKIEELIATGSTKESRIEAIKLIRKHIS